MVQVPGLVRDAVVPETVHIPVVSEAKLTVNPELAVATRFSCVPCAWLAMGLKVMVWVCSTVKLWFTGWAGAYVLFPPCVAWMVQVPGLVREAVVPDTVHTPVVSEAKLTVKLELAVADRLSWVPCVWLAMGLKVMVCD